MAEQGFVYDVKLYRFGSYAASAASAGATSLPVEDASDFDEDGGSVTVYAAGGTNTYAYSKVDFDLDVLTLTSPLVNAVVEGDRCEVYPAASEKRAVILTNDSEETIDARVPVEMVDVFDQGIRVESERENVLVDLVDDEWVVVDMPGQEPTRDGNYIDPTTLPPSPPPAPTVPPSSPAPTVIGGIAYLHVRWDPINHDSAFFVEVHVSTTSGFTPTLGSGTTKVGSSVNGTSFTVTAMPDGSLLQVGTVYYVKTIAYNDAGAASPSAQGQGELRLVDSPDISASAVWAGTVTADSITGGTLNVDVAVAGSLTATGAAGETVSLNGEGFFVRGAPAIGSPVLVEFPTDGAKPNIVSGTLEATTLTVTGNADGLGATFRAANAIAGGATLLLQNAVAQPNASPSVQAVWPSATLQAPTAPTNDFWVNRVPGGVASDGTHLFWCAFTGLSEAYHLCKSRLDGGTTGNARATVSTGYVSDGHANRVPMGVVVIGTKAYVPCRAYTTSGFDDLVIRRYDAATLAFESEFTALSNFFSRNLSDNGGNNACIRSGWPVCSATDGTDIFVGYTRASDTNFTVRRINTSGVLQQTYTSGYAINPFFYPDPAYTLSLYVGNADFGTRRFILNDGVKMRSFTESAGVLTRSSNEDFPVPNRSGRGIDEQLVLDGYGSDGYLWDGTRFKAIAVGSGSFTDFPIRSHSTTRWTTESGTWWVSQTQYDSVGPYETTQSPRTSIGMSRRAYLQVTIATSSTGSGRVYVGRGSSDPGRTAMWLNATLTTGALSTTLDTVTFAGTNPPASGNFPASTPAKIYSQYLSPTDGNPAIELGGDGVAKFDTVLIRGTQDVNTTSGNTPALRTGNIAGVHLRIDGNEIQAMSDDTTTGQIGINGKFFKKFDFGSATLNTGAGGNDTVAHNLGVTPDVVIVQTQASNVDTLMTVTAKSSTNFTINCKVASTGANRAGVTGIPCDWFAITL